MSLAGELADAYAARRIVPTPSSSDPGFGLQPGADPLAAGEIIATGALTDDQFIAPGQSWTASVGGLELPDLTLRTTR